MEKPVFVYYELDNFYQNHRRYVKSRSDRQLRGDVVSESQLSDCEPKLKDGDKFLWPCGLIAHSFFNGLFNIYAKEDKVEGAFLI